MTDRTYVISALSIFVVYLTILIVNHIDHQRNWRDFERREAAFRAAYGND